MIYLVEDDESIRNMMMYTLEASGFEVKGFENGKSYFQAMLMNHPDLVMLDIMLPDMDGIEILKKMKKDPEMKDIPVIMASAKGTEYDKVIGLDLGADDYLAKPFGMMEMVSRVKAVLRRTKPDPEQMVLQAGDLELDLGAHIVKVHGQRVQLTLKEYELLRLFMENINRVFTREQLLSNIWESDYFGETRTVDVHVGTLRTKLQDCGSYIRTVRGVGYRMEIPQ
ncbi:MAG: response regulator transcription factor [Absicoccus porci]|jgi:two-component system alkaline phosphatase synthesis response regulator PhoP|uniref:DNA-binding response regulator n=1 Tax=Absicoccus porci TaxID=2486576 RepID=A0A3N0HYS8_9FIRM|nr:response regulator transcription factor [Absicoccus porci]MCI6088851.1 response regulator transcription factor [Absicoccus porci]MDD6459271.1 response regulator transcription factor [Absicoccus porci]MDD7331148.1 response regulator transcription factor [Absicoccus porci]MDY4738749.1 response regulator transcription factor [Absicoccus porci]MEE1355450.1 response regulator transcription factor [Absicoccus porci]